MLHKPEDPQVTKFRKLVEAQAKPRGDISLGVLIEWLGNCRGQSRQMPFGLNKHLIALVFERGLTSVEIDALKVMHENKVV